jgi:hypothetical protein
MIRSGADVQAPIDFPEQARNITGLVFAEVHAASRLVSVLEGRYSLEGLRAAVAAHVRALM